MRITDRRRSRPRSNVWAGKSTPLVGNYVTVDTHADSGIYHRTAGTTGHLTSQCALPDTSRSQLRWHKLHGIPESLTRTDVVPTSLASIPTSLSQVTGGGKRGARRFQRLKPSVAGIIAGCLCRSVMVCQWMALRFRHDDASQCRAR
jgi:hypothetical protein